MKNRSPFQLTAQKEAIWMLSFSDMTLSLLCFFLLLLSFAHKAASSPSPAQPAEEPKTHNAPVMVVPASNLSQLASTLRQLLREKKLDSLLEVDLDAKGLHLEFADGLLFSPTDAYPNARYKQAVLEIISIIAPFTANHQIKIEGHTDDTPVLPGGPYSSNWELSSARGLSFLHLFLEEGAKDENISVLAYAHTHPKIPYKGLTGSELQAARNANRRVVLWLK